MSLRPRARRLGLTVHVLVTVGWIGALASFLALAVTGLSADDPERMRAAYVAMDTVATTVIVPLALASVLTGLVQSLGTAWGLLRHYWVLVKFLVTLFAAGVLLLQMPAVRAVADSVGAVGAAAPPADLRQARLSLAVHAGGGLVVLLVPLVLSVFKPRGLTPYGERRQRERRAGQQ